MGWSLIMLCWTVANAWGQAWNGDNNPFLVEDALNVSFSKLPLQGAVSNPMLGWPGNHWGNSLGGIAHRWSAGRPQNFTYKSPSLTDLRTLALHEINELSPAEKFDIYTTNYHYPTVRRVFSQVSPRENEWHGICHGYAPAALNHAEPETVTLTNPDGISLTFYSSDVAALLSYFYAKDATSRAILVGERCWVDPDRAQGRLHLSDCSDVNPGAFHLLTTNLMGLKGQALIADIDRYREVWNHVLVSYQAVSRSESAPTRSSARGTVRRVLVEMTAKYAAAIAPKFMPVIGTDQAEYVENTYEYWLDLDARGAILGGEWLSQARPDFVWVRGASMFKGKWLALREIYRPRL